MPCVLPVCWPGETRDASGNLVLITFFLSFHGSDPGRVNPDNLALFTMKQRGLRAPRDEAHMRGSSSSEIRCATHLL